MAMVIYQRDAFQQRRPGHPAPPTPGQGWISGLLDDVTARPGVCAQRERNAGHVGSTISVMVRIDRLAAAAGNQDRVNCHEVRLRGRSWGRRGCGPRAMPADVQVVATAE